MDKVKNFFSIIKAVCKQKCNCKRRSAKGGSGKNKIPNSEAEYFFQKACIFIKNIKNTPAEIQLQLYGLFKQQKDGDAKDVDETQLDYIEKQKLNSWKKYKGLTKDQVFEQYVEIVLSLDPEFQIFVKNYIDNELNYLDEYENNLDDDIESDEDTKGGTTWGLAPSKMVEEEEYKNEKLDELEDLTQEQQQLFDIIEDGNLEYIQQLEAKNIDFNMKNEQGVSVLHCAVDQGEVEIVKVLVQKCNEQNTSVNILDIEGQTPLHYAVLVEDEEIIQNLIENGADPDIKDSSNESAYSLANKNIKQFIDDLKKQK